MEIEAATSQAQGARVAGPPTSSPRGGSDALRRETRGLDHAGGEAALAPRPPVQRQTRPADGALPSPNAATRAATQSAAWQALTPENQARVSGCIENGNHSDALRVLAEAAGIPDLGRLDLEVTSQLGVFRGSPAPPTLHGNNGIAMPYVPAGDRDPSSMRVAIQINTAMFGGSEPVPNRIALIHNVLMHEYTHARQAFASGIGQNLRRWADIEFIDYAPDDDHAEHAHDLDEVDATAAELENAQVTGLSQSTWIRTSIGYLWENFQHAMRRHPPPEAEIGRRVWRAILAGRAALMRFMGSRAGVTELQRGLPPGTPLGVFVRQYLFPAAGGYDPQTMHAILPNEGALYAEAQAAWAAETAFANRPRIVG